MYTHVDTVDVYVVCLYVSTTVAYIRSVATAARIMHPGRPHDGGIQWQFCTGTLFVRGRSCSIQHDTEADVSEGAKNVEGGDRRSSLACNKTPNAVL
jgi:hypothetical protein